MRGNRGVLHDIGVLTLGQVLGQLLSVVALVFLARHLGERWFGVVQIGVTVMTYALIAGEWGMMTIGIREVSREDDTTRMRIYVRRHLGLMTVQALVVLGLSLLIVPRLPFFAEDPVVFVLYLFAVLPQVFLLSWVAAGLQRMRWVGVAKTVRGLLYATLVLVVLVPLERATGLPAQKLVPVLYLVTLVGTAIVIGTAVARWFGGFPLPALPPWTEASRRWREATPVATSVIVLRVLLTVDLLLLGILGTVEQAGVYAAAARLVAFLIVAIEVLWAALLPRFSRMAGRDRTGFRRAFNLYLGFVVAALVPVAVGGAVVGVDVMATIYGDDFAGSGPIFRVLIVSVVVLACGMFLANALISEDRQGEVVPVVVAGASLAFLGCVVLIPRLGGLGASYGMALGHVIYALVLTWIVRAHFARALGSLVAFTLVSAAAMAGAVLLGDRLPVFVRVVLGALVYAALVTWPLSRFRRQMGPPVP